MRIWVLRGLLHVGPAVLRSSWHVWCSRVEWNGMKDYSIHYHSHAPMFGTLNLIGIAFLHLHSSNQLGIRWFPHPWVLSYSVILKKKKKNQHQFLLLPSTCLLPTTTTLSPTSPPSWLLPQLPPSAITPPAAHIYEAQSEISNHHHCHYLLSHQWQQQQFKHPAWIWHPFPVPPWTGSHIARLLPYCSSQRHQNSCHAHCWILPPPSTMMLCQDLLPVTALCFHDPCLSSQMRTRERWWFNSRGEVSVWWLSGWLNGFED